MKTVTVRQRWPEIEAALQIEGEIIITRNSEPVAKLVRLDEETVHKRWDPEEHKKDLKKAWGNKR